jgi:hypothetical protein
MVRSVGITAVVLGLAWTGLAGAQAPSPLEKARYINVTEEGKPPQRCKLLKTWREANGALAFQVQAVDTGELMTIVSTQPGGQSHAREMTTRIFRWGRDNKPPAGAPTPPPTATVLNAPPLQPSRSTPSAATARPNSVPATARKPNPAPASAPVRPAAEPYVLTSNQSSSSTVAAKPAANKKADASSAVPSQLPTLTPMSTPVIQHSSASSSRNQLPAIPSTTDAQPRLTPLAAGAIPPKPGNCACSPSCGPCKPCNPCCQSSCICTTPSPIRQPFLRKLFKSNDCCTGPTAAACPPSPVLAAKPAVATPPAPVATKVASKTETKPTVTPLAAKVATEPAKPGDWRQSWGQVEPWKTPAQASKVKSLEVSKRADPPPVQMEPPKQPDPLQAPDQFRDMVMKARPANSKIPQENRPSALPRLKDLVAARNADRQPSEPAANKPPSKEMMPPNRTIVIAADEPNAFWSPQQAGTGQEKTRFNAFDREPPPPPPGVPPASAGISPNVPTAPPIIPGIVQGPPPQGLVLKNPPYPPTAPYTPPPGPPRPMAPDTGVPDAMGNAFTLAGTRRPIPADFGGTPQEPNGFDPPIQMDGSPPRAYSMAMPMTPRPPMPNPAINPLMSVPTPVAYASGYASGSSAMAHSADVPQLLTALKDSLRPSEREAAAEQLSELNGQAQPLVVEQLMKSAREDPAATVRAACVHALAHMRVNTPAAVTLVQDLRSDRDPRVRQEAEEALNLFGASGIQQASHK